MNCGRRGRHRGSLQLKREVVEKMIGRKRNN
jgi:hypothetical protein